MPRPKVPLVIFLLAIAFGSSLRAIAAYQKQTVTHDESISYLAATANQGAFEQARAGGLPTGTWVEAQAWKRFLVPATPFALRQIGLDLARYDIHPPLYFWLLHLWLLVVGVHPWSGPALNILFFLAGALCLYWLARAWLRDGLETAVVTLIWAVSPAVLVMSAQARQYDLFGVVTITFVALVVRLADPARRASWPGLVLLVGVTAVGALTHYHFILIVTGALLLFAAPLARKMRRRLLSLIVAVSTGYLLAFLLHPRFYLSWQSLARRQELEARHLSTILDVLRRLYTMSDTFTSFWVYGRGVQVIIFCLGLAFAIWLLLLLVNDRARLKAYIAKTDLTGVESLYFGAWIGGITIFMYLTFISPIHAMEPRHMGAVWPFYAFLPVLLLRFVPWQRQRLLLLIGLVVLVSGSASVLHAGYRNRQMPDNLPLLARSDRILIDTLEPGILPRILWHVPDGRLLFVTDQDKFPTSQPDWLPLLENQSMYVADLSYDNDEAGRDRILDLLEREFAIAAVDGGVWGVGHIYLLQAP